MDETVELKRKQRAEKKAAWAALCHAHNLQVLAPDDLVAAVSHDGLVYRIQAPFGTDDIFNKISDRFRSDSSRQFVWDQKLKYWRTEHGGSMADAKRELECRGIKVHVDPNSLIRENAKHFPVRKLIARKQ